MRALKWTVALLVLLGTGGLGLYNGINDIGDGEPALQNSDAVAVLLYGICGLMAGLGLLLRKPWSLPFAYGWAAGCVYAASVASFAFHDPTFSEEGTVVGVVGAAIGALLICALAIWAVRSLSRGGLPTLQRERDIPTQ